VRSPRHVLAPLACVALVALAAAGCGGSSSSNPSSATGSTASHKGGTFIALYAGTGTSIDPQVDYDQNWNLLGMTNDGLVGWKRVNGTDSTQLTPDLATSLATPTNGGKTYVFHLRPGIHYSTGAVVKASDVRSSIEREFKTKGPGANFYTEIEGATACANNPNTCDLSKGIITNNATGQITFHLVQQDPQFLQQLALPFAYVVPAGSPNEDIGTHALPATGPYMISLYKPEQEILFVRNPHFKQWSALAQPAGNPNEIDVKIGTTLESAVTEIENGQADWMYDSPPGDRLNEIATKYPSQIHVNPTPQVWYMSLDTRTAPFNNLKVRQAINYATDRSAVIKLFGGATIAQPVCQILPPGFPAFKAYCPYTKNPTASGKWTAPDMAKAKQLIAESGTKGQTVSVTTATDETSKNIGLYFVSLLNQLGYHAKIKLLAASVEYSFAQNSAQDPQMTLSWWYPDYPDPADFFNIMIGCAGFHANSNASPNLSEFCDPKIQKMTEAALKTEVTNPQGSMPQWTAIDRADTNAAAQDSLFVPRNIAFVSKRVGNVLYSQAAVGGPLIDQMTLTGN
jgi:peptide/nickel transport system substrate-binding protein